MAERGDGGEPNAATGFMAGSGPRPQRRSRFVAQIGEPAEGGTDAGVGHVVRLGTQPVEQYLDEKLCRCLGN